MKTKPFLLATAGSTVDGRVIDDADIDQMASSYDPKTYGARLNIEHIRGLGTEGPFRAYGDVLELSVGEVDVRFNDTTEKRKALYGVFDVTDDAKKLNEAGQKLYPSIEIQPNFAGKDFSYLMGVALTDSPASIATERMTFNRSLPGALTVARDEAALLEFATDAGTGDGGEGFLGKMQAMLDKAFGTGAPKEPSEPKKDDKPGEFTAATLRPMFEQLGQTFAASIDSLRTEVRGELDQQAVKLASLKTAVEGTPAQNHTARPVAAGANGDQAVTDC